MPEETMSRELRIPLPQAEPRECFLAISFNGLDEIESAIANVTSASRVLLKRTKFNPESDDFNYNVVHGIRRSDVVIAVINNKKDHVCPINANVAYEIGIAHALEKPLIIIARDMKEDQRLFADIKKFLSLDTHQEGEFNKEVFKRDLQIDLARKLTNSYNSKTWEDSRLVNYAPQRQIANGLEKAYAYGRRIQDTFQRFVSGHLTPLSEAALVLLHSRTPKIEKYEEAYKLYELYYLSQVKTLLRDLPKLRRTVVDATTSLEHTTLQKHCTIVHKTTSSIDGCYENTKSAHDDAISASGENARHNEDLCGYIEYFRRCCTDVISATDAYLTCLVEILLPTDKGAAQ